MKKKLQELAAKLREAQVAMEAASEESFAAAKREFEKVQAQYLTAKAEAEAQRENQPKYNAAAELREALKSARTDKATREITLLKKDPADHTSVKESGAINLDIKELIPTLNEGLGLPTGLRIVTGVTGDVLYPYGIDDAEMEELGENVALTDQDLKFDQLKVSAARTGLSILVSNAAIDNAAFDLMGYVQTKFGLALKKYLAKKIYSQAAWTGNHGPFSQLTVAGTINITAETAYKQILARVAEFTDKGYDASKVCLVMDAVTEANLKTCPKISKAAAGFVIENSKCCGYDYVVTHYINTTLDENDKLVATEKRYIGIGYFDFEAVQQHGDVRMTIDATSKAVAIINSTAVVLNTAWSMTDLSVKVNGGNGQTGADATQAFALYEVA